MSAFRLRRRRLLGLNARNAEFVYARNPRPNLPFADDKLVGKEALEAAGVRVPPTLAVFSTRRDLRRLEEILRAHDTFVVKPARGKGGSGILVVRGRQGEGFRLAGDGVLGIGDLKDHMVDMMTGAFSGGRPDRAFLERMLIPHESLAGLSSGGLPDVRVITLEARPVLAMLRLATRRSGGRANLHQGGLGVGVDLAGGLTTGGWHLKRRVETHPETGTSLVGIRLPSWPEIVDLAVRAAKAVPLDFLGVDLTVDASLGPVVVELNARPGIEIQNVSGLGLRDLLEVGA